MKYMSHIDYMSKFLLYKSSRSGRYGFAYIFVAFEDSNSLYKLLWLIQAQIGQWPYVLK